MATVSVSKNDGALSTLVERAESGETVEIERDGRVVARLVPAQGRSWTIDFDALARLRESGPKSTMTVEEMRRLDLL